MRGRIALCTLLTLAIAAWSAAQIPAKAAAAAPAGLDGVSSPQRSAQSSAAPSCPATIGGVALVTVAGAATIRDAGGEKLLDCSYPVPAHPTEIIVFWQPANPPAGAPCGLPENRGTADGEPYVYRYSQTKAARLYVSGPANLHDEMLRSGALMLAAAEAEAAPCPRAPAPSCPPSISGIAFFLVDGSPHGKIQDFGTNIELICDYLFAENQFPVTLTIGWVPANHPPNSLLDCSTPEQSGTIGSYLVVRRRSQTKVAFLYVVAPANLLDGFLAAATSLLAAAEAEAAPCPGAQPPPAPPPAQQPPPPPAAAGATTDKQPEGDILPDEAYTGPGFVSGDGIAARVLDPGSELPTSAEAAAAAAALAAGGVLIAGAGAIGSRRREQPAGPGILQTIIQGEIDPIKENEARRILRKTLPKRWRPNVDLLDDPVATLTALTAAAGDARQLGRAVRHTLATNPRLVQSIFNRNGVSTPLLAALGGPERVVRIIEGIARNPPRAIGKFFKDAIHNLTHLDELGRHFLNAIKRIVDSTPLGPIVRGLTAIGKAIFRPRHRNPRRPGAPAPGSPAQAVSQVDPASLPPTTLASGGPPRLVDPDPGGETGIPR